MRAPSPYRKNREKTVRVVVEMPPDEVDAVDTWGVEAEMPSRTAAIRSLLREALKVERAAAETEKGEARRG